MIFDILSWLSRLRSETKSDAQSQVEFNDDDDGEEGKEYNLWQS